jgi:hypothetical protein
MNGIAQYQREINKKWVGYVTNLEMFCKKLSISLMMRYKDT